MTDLCALCKALFDAQYNHNHLLGSDDPRTDLFEVFMDVAPAYLAAPYKGGRGISGYVWHRNFHERELLGYRREISALIAAAIALGVHLERRRQKLKKAR